MLMQEEESDSKGPKKVIWDTADLTQLGLTRVHAEVVVWVGSGWLSGLPTALQCHVV